MPQYRIRCTEDYLVESYQRYRAQSPNRYSLIPLKVIGFLGLALLLAIGVGAKVYTMALLPGFFLLLLLAGPRFDYWLMKRRFRRSPFYGNLAVIDLSEAGYKSESEGGKAEMPWRTFTNGRRLHDGFLLFTGPSQFHWWPDSALTEGTVTEVERLLRSSVAAFGGRAGANVSPQAG